VTKAISQVSAGLVNCSKKWVKEQFLSLSL